MLCRWPLAEAVRKYLRVRAGIGYSVKWIPELTYYIIEPKNCLASREHDAVVSCENAQDNLPDTGINSLKRGLRSIRHADRSDDGEESAGTFSKTFSAHFSCQPGSGKN